jgi:hypothetical protein
VTPTTCKRCRLELRADDFYRDRNAPDGRANICRHCLTADRREAAQSDEDGALQARLAGQGVVTVAEAYAKGRQEGAAAAVAYLRHQGRLRHSDDAAEAAERRRRIAARADEALAGSAKSRSGSRARKRAPAR